MIRLSKSSIGDAEKQAVLGVLDREFLGMGQEVKVFEEMLSTFFGRQVVCVVNGTAALHLALQAVDIGRGDEVLVPSLTYVASFQAISATGATPVACDIDPKTLTMSLEDAERRVTKNTKAIMPVHYGSGVGDLEGVYSLAKKYGLRVIEDAAHAFGTRYKGNIIGGFGDISCFSFDGIKNITSGEGGCICTDDELVLKKVRDARLLGVEKDSERRYRGERSWDFNVTAQGWRYHMSNIMAAIGIEQLKNFPVMAAKRQKLALHYNSILKGFDDVSVLYQPNLDIVPHIYVVLVADSIKRDMVRERLLIDKVQTGIHYFPNHRLAYYRGDRKIVALPTTEKIYSKLLSLPLHVDMDENDVVYVCEKLREALL